MALTIGTNVASLQASAAASSVNRDLETSMARLSTGKRINSASDDAAGVAIASRLSSEIRGTDQAIRNALDGQALIDTAEGGHKEIEAILQRMREISIQAANDVNSSDDRANLQTEMTALRTEIDRIAGVTTWAGNSVMSGTGSANTTKTFSLQVGAATGTKNQIAVSVGAMDSTTLTVGTTYTASAIGADGAGATNSVGTISGVTFTAKTGNAVAKIVIEGVAFSTAAVSADDAGKKAQNTALATAINGSAAMKARGITATNADTATGLMTLAFAQGSAVHVDDQAHAKVAIGLIDAAIKTVNTQRSSLGAVSNRLSHTVSNMTNISTNLSAARGGIEDADFALETTQLAKNQILQQASTAMLAQANASKQNVLSLLQ
jgi:flagellin